MSLGGQTDRQQCLLCSLIYYFIQYVLGATYLLDLMLGTVFIISLTHLPSHGPSEKQLINLCLQQRNDSKDPANAYGNMRLQAQLLLFFFFFLFEKEAISNNSQSGIVFLFLPFESAVVRGEFVLLLLVFYKSTSLYYWYQRKGNVIPQFHKLFSVRRFIQSPSVH